MSVSVTLATPCSPQENKGADDQLILQNSAALDRAETFQGIFQQLYREGDYDAAAETAARILKIREEVFGNAHPLLVASLNNLATVQLERNELDLAEKLYQRVISIADQNKDREIDLADTYSNLGFIYFETDRLKEARTAQLRALQLKQDNSENNGLDQARTLSELGLTETMLGQYSQAQRHLQRALEIKKKHYGLNHPSTANTLSSIGSLYQTQGNFPAAEAMIEKALGILIENSGEQDEQTIVVRSNYASLLLEQQKYKQARPEFVKILDQLKQLHGDNHVMAAQAMNNLAACVHKMGDTDQAAELYRRCLEIRTKKLGDGNTLTATTKANLARVYRDQQKYSEAEELLIAAYNSYLEKFDSQHPLALQTITSLATLYVSVGHPAEAIKMFDMARRGSQQHVMSILPALSEDEQLRFLKQRYYAGLSGAVSAALKIDDDSTAITAAEWIINGKAVAYETLAQKALLARKQTTPELEKDRENLIWVREQLAAMSVQEATDSNKEERGQMISELRSAERRLARKLGFRHRAKLANSQWIGWKTLQATLPAGTAFVDILRYNRFDFQKPRLSSGADDEHYAAWVTLADDPANPTMLDLGPADAIDQLVRTFIQQTESSAQPNGSLATLGEKAATEQIADMGSQLADKVWKPIAESIGGTKRIIISPDSTLWFLPWACLPDPEDRDRFLVEEYNLTLTTSARQLLTTKLSDEPGPASGKSLVVFDPNYDVGGETKKKLIQNLPATDRNGSTELPDFQENASTYLPQVKRLPFTAIEAQSVQPKLAKYAGQQPMLAANDRALETLVKSVANPRVAMFSTHGFFLDDGMLPGIANPLLRSGLLLAGCNRAESQFASDDGILTGLEICGLDYRTTELVVLSACQTGLGDLNNGEGVSGLRQAFELAGAESVLASLWQVDDAETARLMNLFFENLANGKSKSESLRQAQLTRIAARRERHGAAHPFFWAAFTLTGKD